MVSRTPDVAEAEEGSNKSVQICFPAHWALRVASRIQTLGGTAPEFKAEHVSTAVAHVRCLATISCLLSHTELYHPLGSSLAGLSTSSQSESEWRVRPLPAGLVRNERTRVVADLWKEISLLRTGLAHATVSSRRRSGPGRQAKASKLSHDRWQHQIIGQGVLLVTEHNAEVNAGFIVPSPRSTSLLWRRIDGDKFRVSKGLLKRLRSCSMRLTDSWSKWQYPGH